MNGPSVDVRWNRGASRITVDGQPLTDVKSATVEIGADSVPRVYLQLDVINVTSTVDGADVTVTEETRELLQRVGWADPKAVQALRRDVERGSRIAVDASEDLRQAEMRQRMAEAEVITLRTERDALAAQVGQLAEVEGLRGLLGEALDLALGYMRPVPLPERGFERLTPPSPAEEQAWREGVAEITRLREAGGLT